MNTFIVNPFPVLALASAPARFEHGTLAGHFLRFRAGGGRDHLSRVRQLFLPRPHLS
jgi:hypothetical protein